MKAWTGLAAALALAFLAAALALRPPSPRQANAPATQFSAARAFADVAAIAQRPHPAGSTEQTRVRAYLMGRMAALGLAPIARPFASDRGELVNLLGRLPGADPAEPAVLLMAHYDSVPAGPGAADDGAGVAAILEAVRAIKASGPLKRDLEVLLTDGEEPGLYGGRAFFSADPERGHVGVVINLEARGDRGRAVMFETQRRSGAMVDFLIGRRALWGASSLAPDLYRRLPNKTDLTEALTRGYQGLNFAFFGGLDAYHRPLDTPDRLDLGSLQSMGDQALAAARALGQAAVLPGPTLDRVYADLLGGPILSYPPAAGVVLLTIAGAALAGAMLRSSRSATASMAGIFGGAAGFLLLIALLTAAFAVVGALRAQIAGPHLAPLLRHEVALQAGLALLAAGLGMGWFELARRRLGPQSLWLGSLTCALALAFMLQAAAPLDAPIVAWPVGVGCISAALASRSIISLRGPLFILATAMAAQTLYGAGMMFALAGQTLPTVLGPSAALVLLAMAPLAGPTGRKSALAAMLGIGGVALTLAAVVA